MEPAATEKGIHPADILAMLRKRGYTLSSVARELGKAPSTVQSVTMRGKRSKEIEARIAGILEMPVEELWAGR